MVLSSWVLKNCCRNTPQRWDNPKPTRPRLRICDDVLSSARAVSGDDFAAPLYAAVPIAPHAARLAVKPDGISTNRTVDKANAAKERTARSNPDGHTKIFPKRRLGAHPRTPPGRLPRLRPARPPAARGPAADSGNSADGDTPGHPPSSANSGWHSNAANALPHPDTTYRNTAPGDSWA